MIGVALHLMALVPAAVAARVTRAALGLLCRAPQGSEIEQLAAECDVLRGERDTARLEHAAAVEVCDELRGLLTKARAERLEALQWRGVSLGLEREVVEARKERDELRQLVREFKTAWTAHMTPGAPVTGWAWKEVLRSVDGLLAAIPTTEAPRG